MSKKLGLVLIVLFMALSFGVVSAKTDDPIGYEINGDVVEIWNPDTVYYFNKTNGVQWVENPDVYWSRNVFSVGYYAGGEWVQMYSADDLGTFNKDIESDFETYVTATLWKDFNYNGYDLRLGIQYHLELMDTDLSVTLYAKNLDSRDYPVPLGVSWTLTDIDIPNEHNNDRLYINQTYYPLDGVFDETFTDMQHDENGTTVYDSNYRLSDWTEYLTLEWDHSLPYSVHIQGNGVQSETTVTWMVNAGIFKAGQEKSATLYWADAEGDYLGTWNLDALNQNSHGITCNDTRILVTDSNDATIYVYDNVGGLVDSWLTKAPENADPWGVLTDDSNIWVVDNNDAAVYKYNMAGGYVSVWNTNALNANPYGGTTDGTNIWIVDFVDDAVYKYNMAGGYIGVWSTNATSNDTPRGITTDGTNIWVTNAGGNPVVNKYDMSGTWVSLWDTKAPENANPFGICINATSIMVQDTADHAIYIYETAQTPINIALDSDAIFSKDEYGWVNATVWDGNGVAEFDTVTIQVNTTGDSENFTLRWTQATNTFSEVSDLDNICTLGTSVRTNFNVTTDIISFNFTITGGQAGVCDVRLTTIDDVALSDVDLYASEFTFDYYDFNPTADLIDAAFEQFGIIGYMTSITTWINGMVSKFESSLTRILALILLQFTVIEQVYGFFTGYATSIFAIALTFSTFWQSIMDGTSPWVQPLYDLGNFWDLIGYDSWAPAVPMLLFIWWIDSIPKRAAQTVGGELQVFINDINTAIGLISYFVSIFSYVANTIIDRIYGLFPAIT